jgi:hypothetical protein
VTDGSFLSITVGDRTYSLYAEANADTEKWAAAIQQAQRDLGILAGDGSVQFDPRIVRANGEAACQAKNNPAAALHGGPPEMPVADSKPEASEHPARRLLRQVTKALEFSTRSGPSKAGSRVQPLDHLKAAQSAAMGLRVRLFMLIFVSNMLVFSVCAVFWLATQFRFLTLEWGYPETWLTFFLLFTNAALMGVHATDKVLHSLTLAIWAAGCVVMLASCCVLAWQHVRARHFKAASLQTCFRLITLLRPARRRMA